MQFSSENKFYGQIYRHVKYNYGSKNLFVQNFLLQIHFNISVNDFRCINIINTLRHWETSQTTWTLLYIEPTIHWILPLCAHVWWKRSKCQFIWLELARDVSDSNLYQKSKLLLQLSQFLLFTYLILHVFHLFVKVFGCCTLMVTQYSHSSISSVVWK